MIHPGALLWSFWPIFHRPGSDVSLESATCCVGHEYDVLATSRHPIVALLIFGIHVQFFFFRCLRSSKSVEKTLECARTSARFWLIGGPPVARTRRPNLQFRFWNGIVRRRFFVSFVSVSENQYDCLRYRVAWARLARAWFDHDDNRVCFIFACYKYCFLCFDMLLAFGFEFDMVGLF